MSSTIPVPATTHPIRIVDGPATYVFLFTRDLDNNVCIQSIIVFDDFSTIYGETVRYSNLPDRIRLRYWRVVGETS